MAKLREGHPEWDALYYQIKVISNKLGNRIMLNGDKFHMYMLVMEKARLQLLSPKADKQLLSDGKSITIKKATIFMHVPDPELFIRDCQKEVNEIADTHQITIKYEGNCDVNNWIMLTYTFKHITDSAHTIQDIFPFDVNELTRHSEKVNAITSL